MTHIYIQYALFLITGIYSKTLIDRHNLVNVIPTGHCKCRTYTKHTKTTKGKDPEVHAKRDSRKQYATTKGFSLTTKKK